MSWVRRYRDISPVTLQVVSGVVTSTLYRQEVEGLSVGGVESFLVEFYRCKLCQFTCSLKSSISSHLQHKHPPTTLTFLEGVDGGHAEEAELEQRASPYQLDLNGESKQSDEDEDFLLYNMLDNMSPPTCDISSEGGLQVSHTCEVSTLFEEDEEEENAAIFPLKCNSVNLSCSVEPPATQEEIDQSAHLMTLGLCRISTVKSPPPPFSHPQAPPINPQPPPDAAPPDSLKKSNRDTPPTRTPLLLRQGLACLLCCVTVTSDRLLDVHVKSHRANGGFACICCSWTADSWEELEPHWRSHCRRKRRRRRSLGKVEQEKSEKKNDPRVEHQRNIWKSEQQKDGWRQQQLGQKQGRCGGRLKIKHLTRSEKKIKTKRKENKDQQSTRSSCGSPTRGVCFCSLCHRKFSSKFTLRRHLGTHGGEKPHSCPQCSYSSRLKASLLQHLRTHTGEKPYKCAECPYASIDRSSLLRHSRTHSKEKPYRCERCAYSSIQKKSLDLHVRRHHTGEVFLCQQCQYSSPDRQLLHRHVRRHHASSQHAAF